MGDDDGGGDCHKPCCAHCAEHGQELCETLAWADSGLQGLTALLGQAQPGTAVPAQQLHTLLQPLADVVAQLAHQVRRVSGRSRARMEKAGALPG